MDKLPFDIKTTFPKTATNFRKQIENNCKIKKPVDIPLLKKIPEQFSICSDIVNLNTLGYIDKEILANNKLPIGGEDFALMRLNNYFWKNKLLHNYFNTRNNLMGKDFPTKLGHYLSSGCI